MQAEFERGVAMLHLYWFNYAGKTFRRVLERDPSCAIAYWGLALDLLGNTPVGAALAVRTPPRRGRLLEEARAVGQNRARGRLARGRPGLLPGHDSVSLWTGGCPTTTGR